ncbi:8449_t:CDS:1, partial [Cetraspora pellucida]
MSRHRLLQFDKSETLQFHLRAPKTLRNLSSSNEDIFLTQLNNFTLQNNSYQSSSWQYKEEQFYCNNL